MSIIELIEEAKKYTKDLYEDCPIEDQMSALGLVVGYIYHLKEKEEALKNIETI